MPAEWEPHRATWIAWPHHEPDWPGKLGADSVGLRRDRARARRARAGRDPLPRRAVVRERAARSLEAHGVRADHVRLHLVPTDRVWLRDSAPTGVVDADGRGRAASTGRSTPGRSTTTGALRRAGRRGDRATSRGCRASSRRVPTTARRSCSKAAASRPTATALLLVTEEWLLSDVQVRNPGLTREGYERSFREWLGIRADDLARRRLRRRRHARARRRHRALRRAGHDRARGRGGSGRRREPRAIDGQPAAAASSPRATAVGPLKVVQLPYPRPVMMNGERLPASYANFYIANGVVLVPTFNDPNDRVALNIAGRADAPIARSSASTPSIWCGAWARCTA